MKGTVHLPEGVTLEPSTQQPHNQAPSHNHGIQGTDGRPQAQHAPA